MNNSSNLVWIEDFSVHASDTDYRSQGKLSFILDIMQCAADFAVGNLGISVEEILNAGMGWMMITLDLDFKRIPAQMMCLAYIPGVKVLKGLYGNGIIVFSMQII